MFLITFTRIHTYTYKKWLLQRGRELLERLALRVQPQTPLHRARHDHERGRQQVAEEQLVPRQQPREHNRPEQA